MASHVEIARKGRGGRFVSSVGYSAKKLAGALGVASVFVGAVGAKAITPTIPSPPGGGWTSYSPPSNWGSVPVQGFCSEVGMISGYIGGVFAGCFDSGAIGGGWGGRGPITEPVGGGNDGGGGPSSGGTNVAGRNADQKLPCKNNPIIISTGNKIEPEGDFSSSGEMPLALARTYNHYWSGVGLFGKNWVSNFDYKLTFGTTDMNNCYPRPGGGNCAIGANTAIFAWRPDGRVLKFIKRSDGAFYEDKPEAVARIAVQADGSFLLTTEENKTETYNSAGYITKIQDFKNISWTFAYANATYPSRVTHTSGRFVEFIWTNGQLTAVRDPAGNSYGFAYTANQFGTGIHRLASSTKPASPSTVITYHYEVAGDPTALTGKSYNGIRYSKFSYDTGGYATSSEHIGAGKAVFAYTPGTDGALTVVETNLLGKKTTYTYKDGNLLTTKGDPSPNCPGLMYAEIAYDANGNPQLSSDFNGNDTAYTYNAKGQLLKQVEAYGTPIARTTEYAWDNMNRMISAKLLGVSETTYAYAGSTERVSLVQVKNLSANGVANQSRSTSYNYSYHGSCTGTMCTYGMLSKMTVDGPIQGVGSADYSTQEYDTFGNLISVTNGLGQKIQYSNYNSLGLPGRATGANGEMTDYAYDARGRLVETKNYRDSATAVTRYEYDGFGRLAAVTGADGRKHTYQYDIAGRLMSEAESESDGSFNQVAYTYNAMSQQTSVTSQRAFSQPIQGTQP